ncbi:right-handed parallel beta-helix repeat-containing protein [Streptacidiphilus sp. N1-10]|uniref:Right-handed parallel beta-helix repeat-containing protein n=1 Tax=Streptacidiphilus jeojiensis TaxID=3229225 RepID=A0ABV6XLU3_9ACTN
MSQAKSCSDSAGLGSATVPFCTISAAAAVVEPGQTVMVEPGQYNESVTITRSGTADAPITFQGVPNEAGRPVYVMARATDTSALALDGVQHVVIKGFSAGTGSADAIGVNSSSDVILDSDFAATLSAVPAVHVSGGSSDVAVTRSALEGDRGPAVEVDGGSTGTVLASDQMTDYNAGGVGISLQGATGTDVVGNTVVTDCGSGIDLESGATGTTLENNIVETGSYASLSTSPIAFSACKTPAAATGLTVSADSVDGTSAQYNLIDPVSGGTPYTWSGTTYADPAVFQAATGEGAHDLAVDPDLGERDPAYLLGFGPTAGSPAIDAADAAAPGETSTDSFGMPRTDDPAVSNSGTGAGYYDLGADEYQGPLPSPVAATITTGILSATVTHTAPKFTWTTNGSDTRPIVYDFGDSSPEVASAASSVTHSYLRASTFRISYLGFDIDSNSEHTVGAGYVPVAPDRVLDTRHAVGVSTTTPVAAKSDAVVTLPTLDGITGKEMTAVVANVTVTQPTAAGVLTVYPDGIDLPTASNLNFTKGETVANLVTTFVKDGVIRLHNGSAGAVHMVVDLEGFYGPGGNGYKTITPVRVLDTRSGKGASAAGALSAHGTLKLNLSGELPTGATAAVVNLTATQPTRAGFLTAFPAGESVPTSSSLNFSAGQTVPNLVVVPVVNGVADIYNGSTGPVQVVADLDGYYGTAASGATLAFVPTAPERIEDTRINGAANYGGIKAHGTGGFLPIGSLYATLAAAVVNVTVTQPTAAGVLTVYPGGAALPTASNLNFSKGETVPNLVSVGGSSAKGINVYNGSSGTVQLVADEEGYFVVTQ